MNENLAPHVKWRLMKSGDFGAEIAVPESVNEHVRFTLANATWEGAIGL